MGSNTSDTAYENDFPGIKFWLRLFLLFCRGFMTMLDGNPYLQKKTVYQLKLMHKAHPVFHSSRFQFALSSSSLSSSHHFSVPVTYWNHLSSSTPPQPHQQFGLDDVFVCLFSFIHSNFSFST